MSVFQTRIRRRLYIGVGSFNPSTGLSVFQTRKSHSTTDSELKFQSLDWVERLSDSYWLRRHARWRWFQSLDWVERLSDPFMPHRSL